MLVVDVNIYRIGQQIKWIVTAFAMVFWKEWF